MTYGPKQECSHCSEDPADLLEPLKVCDNRAYCAACFKLADEWCDLCGDTRDPDNNMQCQCRHCEDHGWWQRIAHRGDRQCPEYAREAWAEAAYDDMREREYDNDRDDFD